MTYDDRGLPLTVAGGAGVTSYTWDDNGRLDVRTDPAGTADLSYDDAGRLISETDPVTGGMAEYGYDDAGRRTYTASYGPQLLGWPDTPARWTGHDDYGRTSWDVLVKDSNGTGDDYARSYGYDNDGLQTSVMVWGDSNPADAGFQWGTYNTRGELAAWTDPTGTTTDYTYDKAGNRTQAGAVTYSFDAQNRLTAAGAVTYGWSDRGTLSSVTSGGSTTTSTFDVFGQNLTNGTVTNTYDGLGRIATRNSVPFTYSGLALDPTSDGAWVTNRSLDGTVLSTRQTSGADARWAVVDTHRNVVALRNPVTGQVDNTTRFDPFGQKTGSTGTLSATVGFQGDYTDPTSGEVWMGARHYRPSTATFTSRDTYAGRLDTPVSLNRYTYAHNNPLNMWDPDGHVATDASKATLSRLLAGVDVQSYKNTGDRDGYRAAVNDAFNGYRFTEAMNLVSFLGVDAAKAVAASYTSSVVDPTIAWGRDIAALAWVTTKPSTERNRTPRQETTPTASGPGSGLGVVPHDPSTYPSAKRCREQPRFPPSGTTTTTILPDGSCPFGDTPGYQTRIGQLARAIALTAECSVVTSRSVADCRRIAQIAIDSEILAAFYSTFWAREFLLVDDKTQAAIENALKHALFIGRVALAFGDRFAADLGVRAEFWEHALGSVCGGATADSNADIQNNLIGISMAQQVRATHGAGADRQLVDRIVDSYAGLRRTTDGCAGDIVSIGAQF